MSRRDDEGKTKKDRGGKKCKIKTNRVIGKKNEKLKSVEMEWKKMCHVSIFLLLIFSSNRKLRSKKKYNRKL